MLELAQSRASAECTHQSLQRPRPPDPAEFSATGVGGINNEDGTSYQSPFSYEIKTASRNQFGQYLPPVVKNVWVAWINLCGHVEILCREHGLLLLHVHAATLDQSIGS